MKMHFYNTLAVKRVSGFLSAVMLLCVTFTGMAAAQGQTGIRPTKAVQEAGFLTSETGVIHLTFAPTDYEYPQVVYFAGVPVVMDEMIHKDSSDANKDWIHVLVTAGDGETTLSGYTLYENFVRQDPAALLPPFPHAKLAGGSVTGTTALYRDNGITQDVLEVFANGSELQVMGFTRTHFQVLIDGRRGFVPRDAVQATGEDEIRIKAAEPAFYDSMIPGMEAAYDRMNARLEELMDKYGDINEWTIPLRAQWSQEQIEAGTLDSSPDIWVHLMPGEGDLTEEQARALADAALTGNGLDPGAYLEVFSYYFVLNARRDKPTWQFTYRDSPDNTDWVVQLDREGAVTELRSSEYPASTYSYPVDNLFGGQVVTPRADELTSSQAAGIAWELFVQAYPAHGARETYDMVAALREADHMRAWGIQIAETVNKGTSDEWGVAYEVALRSTTGAVLYSTDPQEYTESITYLRQMTRQMALEKEKGPLFTWSLEDKAEFMPDLYALPEEGQMTQEQAWEIAVKALRQQEGWTDEQMKDHTPYFFFCLPQYDMPLRWDIHVLNKQALTDGSMSGYYVSVDANTGETLWVYGPEDTNG